MDNDNLEETKTDLEQPEYWERMWDEYLAWCRANENSTHE